MSALLVLLGIALAQEGTPGEGVPVEPEPAPPGAPGGDPTKGIPEGEPEPAPPGAEGGDPSAGVPEDGGDPFGGQGGSGPQPTEPQPTEPQATESQPAESQATESQRDEPAAEVAPEPGVPGAVAPGVGPDISTDMGPNFLLAVEDPLGRVDGELSARVGPEATFVLLDDGAPPDPMAGDHIYVSTISGYPRGPITVELRVGDELLASTEVEISPELKLPSLRVRLGAEGASWQLGSDAGMAVEAAPASSAAAGAAPEVTQAGGDREGLLAVGVGLAPGLLLGAAGGWLAWGRRRRRSLARPLSEPGAPCAIPREGVRVWQVPDEGDRLLAVGAIARCYAGYGPVLVVPQAVSRPSLARQLQGVLGVAWLDEENPTVPRIQGALDRLSAVGPAALVVEGVGALELPGPREPPFAVIEELLELIDVPTLVVVTPAEPLPSPAQRVLERTGGGLGEGGELVLALSGGSRAGASWAGGREE